MNFVTTDGRDGVASSVSGLVLYNMFFLLESFIWGDVVLDCQGVLLLKVLNC